MSLGSSLSLSGWDNVHRIKQNTGREGIYVLHYESILHACPWVPSSILNVCESWVKSTGWKNISVHRTKNHVRPWSVHETITVCRQMLSFKHEELIWYIHILLETFQEKTWQVCLPSDVQFVRNLKSGQSLRRCEFTRNTGFHTPQCTKRLLYMKFKHNSS